MNVDKHLSEVEAEPAEAEDDQPALLRKTFRQGSGQSSTTSTDSDDMYSKDFQGPKSVIPDEEGIGFSNGLSGLKVGGDHHVIYEVCPVDDIEAVTIRKPDMQNGTAIKLQHDQTPLPVSNPSLSNGAIEEQTSHYSSLNNGTIQNERVQFRTENGKEVADLYLERIYEKPRSHDFYCPNCQACITKVIIRDREWVNNTTSATVPAQVDKFRCTSCFSFLIPIGAWFFPKLASPEEQVSSELGHNIENIGIRERETLQVPQETGLHQESQDEIAPIPVKSVGSAVTDKNKGDPVSQARPSFKEVTAEGRIVQEKTGFRNKVLIPDQSVGSAIADQTWNSDRAVTNSAPSHPSIHEAIVEEGVVLDKSVNSIKGNKIDSIVVGRLHTLQDSKGNVHDQENQAASLNKTQVPDQSTEFNMFVNPKDQEIKIDSTANLSPAYLSVGAVFVENALDGAKDNKEGYENIVVGIPYSSHESNGSLLDKDSQASSINKAQVPNQSNGFAILVESEREIKTNSRPSPTSLEAMQAETLVDRTLDGKKDVDVENIVVGFPYPSQQPKRGLLDRFSLFSLNKKVPVPDQSAGVAKTEIAKAPEPVIATVPDSSPGHLSVGAVTAENVLGMAVNRNEGPVAISINDSVEGRVNLEPSKRWEILKSMVYGGLAELITSLGIVTSAASADATTGNIVGLALANLISGLFIIGHNLAGLKSEQFTTASNETDDLPVDRYEVVLGRRENYILHFTMAILSFLVFGLVPPLVYGLSFPKSNDKDFKLAAVAGASLLCIILLAIGKAHIQRPNKWDVYFKTVLTYVVIGAGAGGLSYLAGDLIDRLIKKYGWFEPSPAVNLPLPEMSLAGPAWASY